MLIVIQMRHSIKSRKSKKDVRSALSNLVLKRKIWPRRSAWNVLRDSRLGCQLEKKVLDNSNRDKLWTSTTIKIKSRLEWRGLLVKEPQMAKLSQNKKRVLSSLLLMSIRPRRTQKLVSKKINLTRKTGSKISMGEVLTKTTKI